MRKGRQPSWRISTNDPFSLLFALYVRDAVRVTDRHNVPPLVPPVTEISITYSTGQRAALRQQWAAWWASLVAPRIERAETADADESHLHEFDLVSPKDSPALHHVQQLLFRTVTTRHNTDRLGARLTTDWPAAMMPTHLVTDIERTIGRRAAPFSYRIDVIPVEGAGFWDLSPTRLMVSEMLYSDTDAFRSVLRPRLTRLA